MGLCLHIDQQRWRAHIDVFSANHPGLIPVIKGDGYGLGTQRLTNEAKRIGSKTIAVGTPVEAREVSAAFPGEILILNPWRADQPRVPGVIQTLSSIETVKAWRDPSPIVVEILTQTRRHGIAQADFGELSKLLGTVNCQGLAFHLPLAPTRNAVEILTAEIEEILEAEIATNFFNRTIWVSHISLQDLTLLRAKYPTLIFLERVGTALWLGESRALRTTATVLDRHRVSSGDRIGYRQRRIRNSGWLLVVAGGTQHGIGLESPPSDLSLFSRIKVLVRAVLTASGIQRSPYSFHGKRLRFAEPPHMQSSLLLISGEAVPTIGADIEVTVRLTTTRFDLITEDPITEK